ncbi:plasmid stabilization system protein ParE [Ensifer sp. 4252]
MRLVWAQYALDDRDAIFSDIESENPNAAVHVDEEIARRSAPPRFPRKRQAWAR